MTSSSLSGKVVVVTHASSDLGGAIVHALAATGARVVAADAEEPVVQLPRSATFHQLDVTDPQSWASLAESLGEGTDGLVNLTELAHPARLAELDLTDWYRALHTNVVGPILGVQALHPLMRRGSSIVNIGSAIAFTGYPAAAETTTMWALRGVTRTANLELADLGIRVNAIHPGFLEAETEGRPAGFDDVALRLTTCNRLARVDDVTALVVFLLSDASDYIAGAEIPVDGGTTSHAGSRLAATGLARP